MDGETKLLEDPFFVVATQNPVETLGCYPLPEAQLDRFLMKIRMEGLQAEEERRLLDRFITDEPLTALAPVVTSEDVRKLRDSCREVRVHADLRDYIVSLVQATRTDRFGNRQGVSPRGTLALLRAAQGFALVSGRSYVVPEDIKAVAVPVLAHRFLSEQTDGAEKEKLVSRLLDQIAVPTEDWSAR